MNSEFIVHVMTRHDMTIDNRDHRDHQFMSIIESTNRSLNYLTVCLSVSSVVAIVV